MTSFKVLKFIKVVKKIKNWPVYFLDKFGLVKNQIITYHFRNGQKVKARAGTADRTIINEIFVYNYYTPKGFEIVEQDVVVDIGAHIGLFSLFASRFASRVYSFEPMDENFTILKENIAINKVKNIVPFRSAVSGKTGEREFFICDDNCGGHSFYAFDRHPCSKKATVRTISLEDIIAANKISTVDFLKIDCEGGEYGILLSCPRSVLNIVKKISMECHDIDSSRNALALKDFLEKIGFAVEIAVASGAQYIFAKHGN